MLGRIAPLVPLASGEAARLVARPKNLVTPVDLRDILIAVIALAHDTSLLTLNLRHFQGLGLATINPLEV